MSIPLQDILNDDESVSGENDIVSISKKSTVVDSFYKRLNWKELVILFLVAFCVIQLPIENFPPQVLIYNGIPLRSLLIVLFFILGKQLVSYLL